MKTLAIELSTERGSLAWFDDALPGDRHHGARTSAVLARDWPNDRRNSATFFDLLNQTVQQLGSPQRVIVGLGPGSYAGVRIAISAAIGLCVSAGAHLIGYPSICAMNTAQHDYVVVGDARRNSFFLIRISARTVTGDYELHGETALRQRLDALAPNIPVFSSDLLPQLGPRLEHAYPLAEILGQLASEPERKFFPAPLEPIYLREANVTISKRGLQKG